MPSKNSSFSVLGKFWQEAGLYHLLADSPEHRQSLVAAKSLRSPSPAKTPPLLPPKPAASDSGQDPAPKAALPNRAILPKASWPEAWLALLNRRKIPSRPKTVWTYAGLEQDLLGQPDPLRQQLVARLIKDLNHPGGTHVFWPCRLSQEEKAEQGEQPSLFWSWEAVYRPRAILVLGHEASLALQLPLEFKLYTSQNHDGRQIVFLPEPDKLARDPAVYSTVLALLSGLLAYCKLGPRPDQVKTQ